ncbi:RteC domain-containing protein [Soonwooa purpurea]
MHNTTFFKNIELNYQKLEQDLLAIHEEHGTGIMAIENCLIILDGHIRQLRSMLLKHHFEAMGDEIYFFKEVKPKFIAKYIYYNKALQIEVLKPLSDIRNQRKFYQAEIKKIKLHQDSQSEFYHYYKRNATFLDQKYFVRYSYDLKMAVPNQLYDFDENFTTSHDYSVASILADTMLLQYISDRLLDLDLPEEFNMKAKTKISWTLSKVAIIELFYALHQQKAFNNGNSDLSELMRYVENVFDIKLGNFHKVIQEIKYRKTNRTKFLNLLTENLNRHFLDNDE